MRKIFKKAWLVLTIIFAAAMLLFVFMACSDTAAPPSTGGPTTPPTLSRPHIPAQTGTLNQTQANDIIDAWFDFIYSDSIPAFAKRFVESEVGTWQEDNQTFSEGFHFSVALIYDGTNYFFEMEEREQWVDETEQWNRRAWYHNGRYFEEQSFRSGDGQPEYSRFETLSPHDEEIGMLIGEAFWQINDIIDDFSFVATQHGNYTRLIFEDECEEGSFKDTVEVIFDADYRVVWVNKQIRDYWHNEITIETFEARIVWGSTIVPAPNVSLFNQLPAVGISITLPSTWQSQNTVSVNAGNHVFLETDEIVTFAGDIDTHRSWYQLIIEIDEDYEDYIGINNWGSTVRLIFLQEGTVAVRIRARINPSVYEIVIFDINGV